MRVRGLGVFVLLPTTFFDIWSAVMSSTQLAQPNHRQERASNLPYDLALLLFRLIINIFFREVRPRGAFNIPREGPVIFVGAPHSNQVRPLISTG